jgi:hypothetical protein
VLGGHLIGIIRGADFVGGGGSLTGGGGAVDDVSNALKQSSGSLTNDLKHLILNTFENAARALFFIIYLLTPPRPLEGGERHLKEREPGGVYV